MEVGGADQTLGGQEILGNCSMSDEALGHLDDGSLPSPSSVNATWAHWMHYQFPEGGSPVRNASQAYSEQLGAEMNSHIV